MIRRALLRSVALQVLVATAASAAPSGPASSVTVNAPPCIERPYDRQRLVDALRIELALVGVREVIVKNSAEPDPTGDRILASIVLSPFECSSDADEVTLTVVDHASSKRVERRMTFSDVPIAERPRALAIAISELLQASLSELELSGAPPASVRPPAAVRAAVVERMRPAEAAARREADRRVEAALEESARRNSRDRAAREQRERAPELEVGGFVWSFPIRGTALIGGLTALRLRGGGALSYRIGATVGAGGVEVPAGSASVGAATGSMGLGLTTGGSTELDVSASLHAGYGWARGTPSATAFGVDGRFYGNGVVLLLLGATLRARSDSAWSLLAGLDVGYVLADVSFLSESSRVAGIGGVTVGARAGVSLNL
jgi:hypothetical protein